ncbi:acetyltransferase [Antarcticibacterium sp. 1MA-6-2]|uniref:acetyltransferase n=1 Tax=Antarcticibacterium sp. 1MA-6-2 TaxID=2908210 RepID=UPI001F3FE6E5|nr:acetyltransferase [Antarcticibacterium sp. 1MA-6-2]UJH91334.1 acetyltransferase [Antarcticibacterium sp. 1MA-6-2]
MKKIILIGASDHCRYTIDIIEQEGKYEISGILDKNLPVGEEFGGYPVLGYLNDLPKLIEDMQIVGGVIAIGDNFTRKRLQQEIEKSVQNFTFINAIHPSVIFGKKVEIGSGCVFMAGVIVNNNCKIGDHCFLATKCSLDHDSTIGNFSSMSPGVTTGGRVSIGDCTAIGIGASILHYKSIGDYCVIGGNSLVNKDIEDYYVAFGILS